MDHLTIYLISFLLGLYVGGMFSITRTFYDLWNGEDPVFKWVKWAVFTPFLWPVWLTLMHLNVGKAPLYEYKKYRRNP